MAISSRTYSTRGIVLRTFPLGESDRIVVIATASLGIIRAVAKGVRKTGSKFGSRLEPFMVSDLQMAVGRGSLHTVTQAVSVSTYGTAIVTRYEAYTYAHAIAELTEILSEEEHEENSYYDLLLGALAALARNAYPSREIFSAFALRSMVRAGWDMATDACAITGETSELLFFSAAQGGVVSLMARPAGAKSLKSETATVLSSLKSGDWEHVLQASPQACEQAYELVLDFLGWHVERRLKTLSHMR